MLKLSLQRGSSLFDFVASLQLDQRQLRLHRVSIRRAFAKNLVHFFGLFVLPKLVLDIGEVEVEPVSREHGRKVDHAFERLFGFTEFLHAGVDQREFVEHLYAGPEFSQQPIGAVKGQQPLEVTLLKLACEVGFKGFPFSAKQPRPGQVVRGHPQHKDGQHLDRDLEIEGQDKHEQQGERDEAASPVDL